MCETAKRPRGARPRWRDAYLAVRRARGATGADGGRGVTGPPRSTGCERLGGAPNSKTGRRGNRDAVNLLTGVLEAGAAAAGDQGMALVGGTTRWTYADLRVQSRRIAGALAARGIERGDRV